MKIIGHVLFFMGLFSQGLSIIPPSQFIRQHPLVAVKAVNFLTHKLPMLDTFGHKNLELNDQLIPLIMNNPELSSPLKADLVTGLIRFSQFGDNFGSWILSHYLELITYLVNSI